MADTNGSGQDDGVVVFLSSLVTGLCYIDNGWYGGVEIVIPMDHGRRKTGRG